MKDMYSSGSQKDPRQAVMVDQQLESKKREIEALHKFEQKLLDRIYLSISPPLLTFIGSTRVRESVSGSVFSFFANIIFPPSNMDMNTAIPSTPYPFHIPCPLLATTLFYWLLLFPSPVFLDIT
jgi:hypothetical protein